MIWIVIVFYLVILFAGATLIWRAYQLGIKKNSNFAKGLNGLPYKNPKLILKKLAITELVVGFAIIGFAIAIPVLKITFYTWASFISGIGLIRLGILMRFAKDDKT